MIQRELFDFAAVDEETRLGMAFDDALRALVKKKPRPPFDARFYPYAGLSSTIRLRNGRIHARVSDILRHAPAEVLRALAVILVARLYKLRVPAGQERLYREHLQQPDVVEASETTRRKRGFKITTTSKGKVYDLGRMFDTLNARYFGNELERPLVSWGQKHARRVLGHHDHVHGTIILSPSLDSAKVPEFVVEYVLFHEMLHVKHRPKLVSGRTVYHSRAFAAEERRFEHFGAAVSWLETNPPSAWARKSPPQRSRRPRASGTNSTKKR
jgi:hypothetical protein